MRIYAPRMSLDPASYAVAIPSYQRRTTLASKTLPRLRRGGIDPRLITVFVADEREAQQYRQALLPQTYGQLVIGAPGMGGARNAINRYYPDGTLLLQIDDDIADICELGPAGRSLVPVMDLHALFVRGFTQMLQAGATLWGVYPVDNPFFMRKECTTDLKYIVGALFGVLNEHAPHCQVTLDDKEDFQRTLLHYLHTGTVVRLGDITLKTRYYKEPGGMQVTRTEDRITASAHYLAQAFPDLCTVNNSKANGLTELRLRDRREVPA